MSENAPRERLGSRIGFILLSAGCAIGIGNVWKFPYVTGQYGGGFDGFMAEANTGKGLKIKKWMRFYMKYILPLIIAVILGYGIVSPFI